MQVDKQIMRMLGGEAMSKTDTTTRLSIIAMIMLIVTASAIFVYRTDPVWREFVKYKGVWHSIAVNRHGVWIDGQCYGGE